VLPLDSTHFYTKLNTIYNVFCGIHFHRSHLLALGVAITLDSGESTLKACWLLKYWSVSTLVSSGQSSSIKYIRKFLFTQSHVNSANFVMLNPSIQTMSYLILTKLFNTKGMDQTFPYLKTILILSRKVSYLWHNKMLLNKEY